MSESVESRYKYSKVYKLVDQIDGYYYIGSTACKCLSKRFTWHKQDARKENLSKSKKYQYFNSIGWENVKIILIEEFIFQNKMQLLREEDRYIMQHREDPKCLNMIKALRSGEESHLYNVIHGQNYRKDHLRDIRAYDRERNVERNKDKIKCECGVEYPKYQKSVHDKSKHHIEYLIEQDNTLSLCDLGMITCGCGSVVTKKGFIKHMKTKKHELAMKEKEN